MRFLGRPGAQMAVSASIALLWTVTCGRVDFKATFAQDSASAGADGSSDAGTLDGVDASFDAGDAGSMSGADSSSALGPNPVQEQTALWSNGDTFYATMSTVPASGNALIAVVGINGGTVSSISGSGASWSRAIASNVNRDIEIWYGLGASGSGGTAIQLTLSGADIVDAQVNVTEWSGLSLVGMPYDDTGANHGTGADMTTASVTPTAGSARLLIAGNRTTCDEATFVGSSIGWTTLSSPVGCRFQAAYRVVLLTSGAYSNDFKWDVPQIFDTVIASFK
jgi:hypothetical protein